MTSIKIVTNKLTLNNVKMSNIFSQYNEDDDVINGANIGSSIEIIKSSQKKSSGITHVFFPTLLDNDYQNLISGSDSSESLNLESKCSQGISIKNFSDTTGDNLPYIYMGNISPYPKTFNERFAPFLNFSELGVVELVKKGNVLLVYDDTIQEYDHKNYINRQSSERDLIYPNLTGSRYSSIFETNGTIEPIEIRSQFFNTTVKNNLKSSADNKYRNFFSGISVDMTGPTTMRKHGSNIILTDLIDKQELNLSNNAPYNDTNQKVPMQKDLKNIDYDGKYEYTFKPFDELRSDLYLDSKYEFARGVTANIDDLLFGAGVKTPFSKMSEIGSRYISATAGFDIEIENGKDATTSGVTTVTGTDSIAFVI
jgi:hypothetical protein